MNLLLIDSDESYLSQLSTNLKKHNIFVTTATGSGTALKILNKTHIDLVVSGIANNTSQAYYLVLSIKGRYPATPLILLSGNDPGFNFNTALLLGVNELIPRNMDFALLHSAISKYAA
jgi:DNA-binding NtrC family response regulator